MPTESRIEARIIAGRSQLYCRRCGSLVLDAAGHDGYHKVLDDLFEVIERAHRTTFQAVMMLFVGVLSALVIALAAL